MIRKNIKRIVLAAKTAFSTDIPENLFSEKPDTTPLPTVEDYLEEKQNLLDRVDESLKTKVFSQEEKDEVTELLKIKDSKKIIAAGKAFTLKVFADVYKDVDESLDYLLELLLETHKEQTNKWEELSILVNLKDTIELSVAFTTRHLVAQLLAEKQEQAKVEKVPDPSTQETVNVFGLMPSIEDEQ